MSNKDKLRKLEEINTAADARIDPILTRIVQSPYTAAIALIAALGALILWVM